jgi:hypothetical protein
LIVGTGESGFMQVPLATKSGLKDRNITLIAEKTAKAAQLFNEQVQKVKM